VDLSAKPRPTGLETFTTTRLRAERLVEAHWPEVRRMHEDAAVMAHLGGVQSEARSLAYLERNLARWAEDGFGLWILYESGGTTPIGRGVLRRLRTGEVDEVEVGYAFYQEYWGRGLATEITAACLRLGFEALAFPSIVGVTAPGNAASRHVLLKCGLALERPIEIDGMPCLLYRIDRVRWSASSPAR
jgi:RimJ/RimL family protein N-acetyltransferase